MKIVAFMQNQWFKDPAAAKRLYDKYPDHREEFIKRFLFMGCLSGRRLKIAFGSLCDKIIWEECSPEIGGHASFNPKPDPDHIRRVLEKHKPDLVMTFGRGAHAGVSPLWDGKIAAFAHPAARTIETSHLVTWRPMLQKIIDSA